MSKLNLQRQRLFGLPEQAPDGTALALVNAGGQVRTLVAGFRKSSDWASVADLYQAVQVDWEWPAPAISVSADQGFQIWFSLAEPVSLAQAGQFLELLRQRYLAGLPASAVALQPGHEGDCVPLVPALHAASGKWSAFIDPSMGEMFIDEPGLDMAPGLDRQAEMLAALASIAAADFHRVMAAPPPTGNADSQRGMSPGSDHPHGFLLAVMNDPSVAMGDRIEAAKALLPHYLADGMLAPNPATAERIK